MAVVPGNRMVDLDKVTKVLDASHVELAGEREFAVAFPDCEAGAEPPFGTLYDIPTVVDEGIETELPWYSGFRPMRDALPAVGYALPRSWVFRLWHPTGPDDQIRGSRTVTEPDQPVGEQQFLP